MDVYIFGAIPYLIARINEHTGKTEVEGGVDIDVLTMLATILRFKPTGHPTTGWGRKDENGTWQGTIGKVLQFCLLIMLCIRLFITLFRLSVIKGAIHLELGQVM